MKIVKPPQAPNVQPDIRVGFILSPKFTLFAFAGFIDALRHAADEADYSRQIHCHWKVIAPNTWPIRASCGVEVMPHAVFPDPQEFDYIVVVGGLLGDTMSQSEEVFDYIRKAHEVNVTLIGLCVGSFVLAKAGLMKNRKCAVHFEHKADLGDLFPKIEAVVDTSFVEDGNIITCPGGTATLDLAFGLIERHCGRARATKAMVSLIADEQRAENHMGYRPYGHLAVCGNWSVEQAYGFMEKNLSTPCNIEKLADMLDVSARNLTRAFMEYTGESPQAIWRKMRLIQGRWLLLNSRQTITEIAAETGFSDSAHFNRLFKQLNDNITPNAFRKQHKRSFRRDKDRTKLHINMN